MSLDWAWVGGMLAVRRDGIWEIFSTIEMFGYLVARGLGQQLVLKLWLELTPMLERRRAWACGAEPLSYQRAVKIKE